MNQKVQRAAAGLLEGEEQLRQVLEALPAAVYTTDAEGRITFYNRAAAELAGREPVLGSDQWCVSWRLYNPDGTPLPHDQCPMAIALKENRAIRDVEAVAERPDGTRVAVLPYPTPIRDCAGNLIGAVNMLIDISERKTAETHVHAMMHELDHRVKNNTQILQSLLGAAERETTSSEARDVLADAVRRIGAMAAAQNSLSSAGVSSFDVRALLEAVSRSASRSFGPKADIEIVAASGALQNAMAVPVALILNELVTNCVKHARRERNHVSIKMSLQKREADWELQVEDDGPGFTLQPTRRRASGLGLVSGLARQLGGELEVTTAQGACCFVRFATSVDQAR